MIYKDPSEYIIPAATEPEDTRLGWLKEAAEEGETYNKHQRSYRDMNRAMDILSGHGISEVPKRQSNLHINMAKRDVRETVATLSNIRPLWGYKTDNQEVSNLTSIMNKMLLSWYQMTFADRSIRQALQYAGGTGQGWGRPYWKRDFWIAGRGDIALKIYGPEAVLPYQIGPDHNIQDAYVVTIKDEVPFAKALAMYPTQADKFAPNRTMPTWMKRGVRRLQKFLSPVLQQFGPGQKTRTEETEFPTVDIYTSIVLDLSINKSSDYIPMGAPGTNWFYLVPPLGADIPNLERDKAGNVTFHKATEEEARLYPMRRKILWTDYGILSDGSASDWHAKVPLIGFQLDDWPWNFLGCSMVSEVESIQRAATELMRTIENSARCRLRPAMAYDESIISPALMERLNTEVAGQRIKANLQLGDPIKPLLPASYYDVPEWIQRFVEWLHEKEHFVLGIRDIQALAKAKQVPAGDSLEKLMELAGPLVTDMSRNMEASMRDLGDIWKGLAMQNYTLARRVSILGTDGVTEEDFDYDPGNMIPSHMPDELELIKLGKMDRNAPSRCSIVERAQTHMESIYFHVMPNSLHQITQLSRKLINLQLFRSGFPIDPWTLATSFDIENFGTPDVAAKLTGAEKAPTDVFGRWILWKEVEAKLAPKPTQTGRKPTGKTGPALQGKDQSTRTTTRETPR